MSAEDGKAPAKSVVVVEDDHYILDFLRFTLEQQGYVVRTASDGVEGLNIIKSCRPALVVLDLMLPKMDGFTVLKRMAEHPDTSEVPVVVVSAYTASEATKKMVKSQPNVRDVFTKPIRSREFVGRLQSILGSQEN
jgi:two-component system, OmpR family, alkaline phosphatase synthesis response regulator PhoP